MNVYVMTGSHARNMILPQKLIELPSVNLVGHMIFQREELIPEPPEYLSNHIRQLWIRHFRTRELAEEKYFRSPVNLEQSIPTRIVSSSEDFNSKESAQHLKSCAPDIVLITGVPIIREPLFSACPEYRINLHLGLIPDYKGSITMFWPFYFLEPTMAGCTYHIIDSLVDTGFILHQTVPQLVKGDSMFDVACRASLAALDDLDDLLVGVKARIENDFFPDIDLTLWKQGKLFKKSDWKPEMLCVNYDLFDDRMVDHVLDGRLICRKPSLVTIDMHNPN